MSIREKVVEFINSEDYKPMLKEELLINFGLEAKDKKRLL